MCGFARDKLGLFFGIRSSGMTTDGDRASGQPGDAPDGGDISSDRQSVAETSFEADALEEQPDTRPPNRTIRGFALAGFISLAMWFALYLLYRLIS
jgi:hypothetical protein